MSEPEIPSHRKQWPPSRKVVPDEEWNDPNDVIPPPAEPGEQSAPAPAVAQPPSPTSEEEI